MKKKILRVLKSRAIIVWLLIAIQLFLVFWLAIAFTKYYYFYTVATFFVSFAFLLYLMKASRSMSYKMAWMAVALMFPLFGIALYLIFGGNRLSKRALKKMSFMEDATRRALAWEDDAAEKLEAESPTAARQARYIRATTGCPPVEGCRTRYFESGEAMFPVYLEELKKAKKYIFLEYFIIDDGEMWSAVHEILVQKAHEGVDVRLIYDDIGCWLSAARDIDARLRSEGINCRIFQKFVPVLNARQNNRDHRKICAIDGVTAFTGGINLADEYINKASRFGYWKDTAVMVEGPAAWSYAALFLTMWDYLCGNTHDTANDYSAYIPPLSAYEGIHGTGYVQPYTDSPLDGEPVGENVYLGIIEQAQRYLWITTPYLIIDERIECALIHAVQCGVDVRIVTPGIPDKKLISETTKSYYPNLVKRGVKIYEYTPGFVHAKGFVCDDEYAVVGSVNLDYRSLYLHFECGLWMYRTDCVMDVKRDFEKLLEDCTPIRGDEKVGALRRMFRASLDLIAPLF